MNDGAQAQEVLETPAGQPAGEKTRNRYDHMEWAGAFGDIGTLDRKSVV